MRVDAVDVVHVRLRLKTPFQISSGVWRERDTLIVRVWDGQVCGWGEAPCDPVPIYSYETIGTGKHVLRDLLIPAVVGERFGTVDESAPILARFRGHRMAKAGLEMALWDLWCKQQGRSLAEVFGAVRERIASGISIGIKPSHEELFKHIHAALGRGYQRIKLKIMPGADVEVVRAVRDEFDDLALMVDANSAYSLADMSLFRQLDGLGLMMIEQPLHYEDLVDHARLQSELRTPVCLDESVRSEADARKAVELGSCRIINIKHSRVGGLSETRRIHDVCSAAAMPVWIGSMLESGVGEAHNLAMATMPNFTIPGDAAPSDRYFADDLLACRLELNPDGTIDVPGGPGIGVEVDLDKLDAFAVDQFRMEG